MSNRVVLNLVASKFGDVLLMICLFGPDGSGKSTLAELFRAYLSSCDVHAYISWFRGSHLFASVLVRFLACFRAFRGQDNPYYGIAAPSRLRRLWVLVEFASLLPHYLFRAFLSKLHTVIGDRGVLDFIAWIVVTLDHPKFLTSFIGGFLSRLAVKDLAIYVTADLDVLCSRVRNMPHSFLSKEKAVYDVLAKYYAKHVIDTTNKTPKESLEELLKCLQEH